MNDDLVKWNCIENEDEKNKQIVKIYLDFEKKENEYSYNKDDKEVF